MAFFRLLLLPLAILYGLMMQLRNILYGIGFFRSKQFGCPVISVGNVTAGGSGKTPFTIYLTEALQKMGYRPAVVSRGYGRKSHGLLVVSDGREIHPDVRLTGDEPMLIARSLPGVAVVVAEERTIAIEKALQLNGTDLIVMDDGFQHRAVKRDVDIVLTAWPGGWKQYFVLPAGDLREFAFNRERADMIIRTGYGKQPPLKGVDFTCCFEPGDVVDVQGNRRGNLDTFKGQNAMAFCGIARPSVFEKVLRGAGIQIRQLTVFSDHAGLTADMLRPILEQARAQNVKYLFCTEKDGVKIAGNPGLLHLLQNTDILCLYPRIGARINNDEKMFKNIKMILDSVD